MKLNQLQCLKIAGIILVGITAFYFLPPEPQVQQETHDHPQPQAQTPITAEPQKAAAPQAKVEKAPVVLSEKTKRAIALASLTNDLDPQIVELALTAYDKAKTKGLVSKPLLTVIDYSKRSVEKRLWVFDLKRNKLILETHVAHGEGSGNDLATRFSNTEDSRQTSIGVYTTAETYNGFYGYSLRLDGHEKGVNDKARKRKIIMHGADWASQDYIEHNGVLGQSWGCPAVSKDVSEELIDLIKDGSLLFVYYPDKRWLSNSSFLKN